MDQERYQKTGTMTCSKETSLDLVYVGQPLTISEGDSLMLPVQLAPTDAQMMDYPLQFPGCHMVQASTDVYGMEVVPGLWDINEGDGVVTVVWRDVLDRTLEDGDKIGEVSPVQVQTNVCELCGWIDTQAEALTSDHTLCGYCGVPRCVQPTLCRTESCMKHDEVTRRYYMSIISHAGCKACRPEKELLGRSDLMSGPAGIILTDALRTYCTMESHHETLEKIGGTAWHYPSKEEMRAVGSVSTVSEEKDQKKTRRQYTRNRGQEIDSGCYNQVAHIIEEPGKIQ